MHATQHTVTGSDQVGVVMVVVDRQRAREWVVGAVDVRTLESGACHSLTERLSLAAENSSRRSILLVHVHPSQMST